MPVLNAAQTRALEQAAVEGGVSYLTLMENAGGAAARVILEEMGGAPFFALILCGKGNNGGDGFVVARHLLEAGKRVALLLPDGPPVTQEAGAMYARLEEMSAERPSLEQGIALCAQADVIVDGLYGIGFRGSLSEKLLPLCRAAAASPARTFALDLPSGAQCDSGKLPGEVFRADVTVTFSTLKPVHVLYPSMDVCGKTLVRQVGIPEALLDASERVMEESGPVWPERFLPERRPSANKGNFGRLLCLCGSRGMAGAAVMAAGAALRSGAGIVDVALPESIYPIVSSRVTEPVFTLLPEEKDGFSPEALHALRRSLKRASACVAGCGLGSGTENLVFHLLAEVAVPVVLDADGINALTANIDVLKTARAPVILTPHPGEMARLLGCTVAEVQGDRLAAARTFAEAYGVCLLLKGANTLIASPDGRVCVNRTGNPGMATGGSGDVLSGMIGAFLAQGMPVYEAAVCGAYLHGLAGDVCAARFSRTAMLPTDMIEALPSLFLSLKR